MLLPVKEKDKNIGHGRWIRTSASPGYLLAHADLESSSSTRKVRRKKGCRVSLVILPFGSEFEKPNMYLRSDLPSCAS